MKRERFDVGDDSRRRSNDSAEHSKMRGLGFQSMAPFGLRRVRQRVERSSSENLSTAERRAAGAEASGERTRSQRPR